MAALERRSACPFGTGPPPFRKRSGSSRALSSSFLTVPHRSRLPVTQNGRERFRKATVARILWRMTQSLRRLVERFKKARRARLQRRLERAVASRGVQDTRPPIVPQNSTLAPPISDDWK